MSTKEVITASASVAAAQPASEPDFDSAPNSVTKAPPTLKPAAKIDVPIKKIVGPDKQLSVPAIKKSPTSKHVAKMDVPMKKTVGPAKQLSPPTIKTCPTMKPASKKDAPMKKILEEIAAATNFALKMKFMKTYKSQNLIMLKQLYCVEKMFRTVEHKLFDEMLERSEKKFAALGVFIFDPGGDDEGLECLGKKLLVLGWARTCRIQSSVIFIEVHGHAA